MSDTRFRFKQFAVEQSRSAMKVGTDGVLLGAWVSLRGDERNILDIGTGTGVIALMLGQRTQGYGEGRRPEISAVEVEQAASSEAGENFERSPWGDRMRVECVRIQDFTRERRYDLIVSNPPYYMAGFDYNKVSQGIGIDRSSGAAVPTKERIAARHAGLLPYDDLIDAVAELIEPENGRFAAIFPYREFGVFVARAAGQGLYCHRQLEVRGTQKKGRVKRVAAEFSMRRREREREREPGGGDVSRESICIENGDGTGYSEPYKALTRDFYLKF